jgi:hypothetical protein
MTAPDKSQPPKNTPKSVQDYYEHLDQCRQCRELPSGICSTGYALLKKSVFGLLGHDVFEKIKAERPEEGYVGDIVTVISCGDGKVSLRRYEKHRFLLMLNNEEWGKDVHVIKPIELDATPDLTAFEGIVVIGGDVVMPKPKRTVTEYEL